MATQITKFADNAGKLFDTEAEADASNAKAANQAVVEEFVNTHFPSKPEARRATRTPVRPKRPSICGLPSRQVLPSKPKRNLCSDKPRQMSGLLHDIGEVMDIETYRELAIRTAPKDSTVIWTLLHASVGIGGEGGEILDHVKKVAFNGRELNSNHLVAEIGDVMWYINMMLVTLGVDWSTVLEKNIAKLETRYPDLRYDPNRSLNRDVIAEKAAMDAV